MIPMERNLLTQQPPVEASAQHGHLMRSVLAASAGMLLVASCGSAMPSNSSEVSASHPSSSEPGSPTPTTRHETLGKDACVTPRIPVFPGQHFKQSNRDDIARQLKVLYKAHDQKYDVTARDVVNAGAIAVNSLTDPVYAQAFTYANKFKTQSVTVHDLFTMDFSKAGVHCLTDRQLQQTDRLYDTLVDGLAPKVGHQLSTLGRVAYKELNSHYQEFKKKYHQELQQ